MRERMTKDKREIGQEILTALGLPLQTKELFLAVNNPEYKPVCEVLMAFIFNGTYDEAETMLFTWEKLKLTSARNLWIEVSLKVIGAGFCYLNYDLTHDERTQIMSEVLGSHNADI